MTPDDHSHNWPVPFQALEHREFLRLWLATFISNSGSWMQRVSTSWLIYKMSDSIAWLGIDAVAAGVPALLILPMAGMLADSTDRRRLLVLVNVLNALLAMALAALVWTGLLVPWHLILASLLSGTVTAVGAPSSQSIIPRAAGEDHIASAIALNSFQYNTARAAGPAMGGLALAILGAGWCFALNGATFLVMVAALLTLRGMPHASQGRQPARAGLAEVFLHVRERRDLRRLLVLVLLSAFCGAPIVTLLPAVAKLGAGGAGEYSALLTSFGIGAAAAGLLLTSLGLKKYAIRWIAVAGIVVGVAQALAGSSRWFPLTVGAVTLAGAAFVGGMIAVGTELLSRTSDELRGRISALQQLCFRTAQPLGSLVASILAESVGLPCVFLVFAAVMVVGCLALARP